MENFKIEPPFWYVGMKISELQLMLYGSNIRNYNITVEYPGISITSIEKGSSNNYLFVYLHLSGNINPGKMKIIVSNSNQYYIHYYELKQRDKAGNEHYGFGPEDVIYLIMPDRFARGEYDIDDSSKKLNYYKIDRTKPSLRHGGNISGIQEHLDYFIELGVTTLWLTPVLENNMRDRKNKGSYHGYAITDYYNVDPRLGSNEGYKQFIKEAHNKGLKIIMDTVFNHCGIDHKWLTDMPAEDWINNPHYKKHYLQTSYKLTPHVDIYSSKIDYDTMCDGWFVKTMPDLNLRNPHLLKYLIQNSFWWIEFANIDGIRMDTHPYANYDSMAEWLRELNVEYPNFNVVGETWVGEPAYTAFWQKDSRLSLKNSNLPSVMDFSFYYKINEAMMEETDSSGMGLNRIYNNLVYDFLYSNPSMVLAFLDNHDLNRFLKKEQNIPLLKQALVILLTIPRIPQIYYGTEVLMNGTKKITDGNVRKDFPGGWKDDINNVFFEEKRSPKQKEMFDFLSHILKWRKKNLAISKGSMIQFIPHDGIYVYARIYNDKTTIIILNGTNNNKCVMLERYKEVLKHHSSGLNIINNETICFTNKEIEMQKRESMIIDLI